MDQFSFQRANEYNNFYDFFKVRKSAKLGINWLFLRFWRNSYICRHFRCVKCYGLKFSDHLYNCLVIIYWLKSSRPDKMMPIIVGFTDFWRFLKYCSSDFCENGLDRTAVKNWPRTLANLMRKSIVTEKIVNLFWKP